MWCVGVKGIARHSIRIGSVYCRDSSGVFISSFFYSNAQNEIPDIFRQLGSTEYNIKFEVKSDAKLRSGDRIDRHGNKITTP